MLDRIHLTLPPFGQGGVLEHIPPKLGMLKNKKLAFIAFECIDSDFFIDSYFFIDSHIH